VDPARYAELFRSESRELLTAANEALLDLERDPSDAAAVAALFRAVHSLKGMAATMGYEGVATLAHDLETLLETVRSGARTADDALVSLCFAAADALEAGIDAAGAGGNAASEARLTAVRAQVRAALGTAAPAPAAAAPAAAPQRPPAADAPATAAAGRIVKVRLAAECALKGVRAFMVVQRARALGAVSAIWPPLEQLQAEQFDREFSLRLVAEADAATIGADLAKAGDVEAVQVVEAAPAPAVAPEAAAAPRPMRSVRVDVRRLDALLDVVGELVVLRDRLAALAGAHDDAPLQDAVQGASRLIGALHDEVLAARLVPVWQAFDRFPRLVRDAARTAGKEAVLHIEGRETEFDRALLEEIADALGHLLRNAVDHGLEPPAAREAAGKPAAGTITLTAARERGGVLVRVRDDGRGIDRAKVLAKAKATGLVPADRESLTDAELLALVARPGFSTATQVTALSGRGVGIDAVQAKVRAIGGTMELASTPGAGTTVTLRLPATLAITGAVLAEVAGEVYAVPLTHVVETLELAAARPQRLRGAEVLHLRDEVVPLVHLHDLVDRPRAAAAAGQVVVVERAERRVGVVVDRLVGQREIVVKGYDAPRGAAALFSGATVLGDGSPALILDVNTLL
jgi:two-component system chemotaxis sensor kinase CheA